MEVGSDFGLREVTELGGLRGRAVLLGRSVSRSSVAKTIRCACTNRTAGVAFAKTCVRRITGPSSYDVLLVRRKLVLVGLTFGFPLLAVAIYII